MLDAARMFGIGILLLALPSTWRDPYPDRPTVDEILARNATLPDPRSEMIS